MADTLLPISATTQERSLEAAAARVSDVPVPVRDAWNPDACPAALLPWLAWQFSVDQWDAKWPVEAKREAIRQSIYVHRHKGTVASVRAVFASIGFGEVQIIEGRNRKKYDGTLKYDGFGNYGDASGWPYYMVRFFKLLSTAQANQAAAILGTIAPLRSKLWAMDFTAASLIYNGVAKYDGSYKHGVVAV